MPLRDDLVAAHARIAALERELAVARRTATTLVPAPRRAPTAIPRGFEVTDGPDELRIAWRARDQPWPTAVGSFAGLCITIAVALIFDRHAPDVFVLCVAAVVCGLVAIWQIGDRVEIQVRTHHLLIPRSPVSRSSPRSLARGEIEQLYCVHRHGEKKHTYELWCQLRGGLRLRLVRAIETAEAALFIEDRLERRLGIPDRPVDGELVRG